MQAVQITIINGWTARAWGFPCFRHDVKLSIMQIDVIDNLCVVVGVIQSSMIHLEKWLSGCDDFRGTGDARVHDTWCAI